MIGYVTLGTNDIERAAKFYDALLAELGATRMMSTENLIMWSVGPGKPMLAVIKPHNGKVAVGGNGTMVALIVDSKDKVDTVYKKAIALGATDEGPNGPRGDGFYAGYFRDADGNKLNVFVMG